MKISIITVNFNNKTGLQKTANSVKIQTYNDFEWIVVDGGSTDGSREIIFQNCSQINFWCSEPDNGIYNAMNKGVSHATGDYCIFMNSGDCFSAPNVLFNVSKVLGEHDIICGDTIITNEVGGLMGHQRHPDEITIEFLLTGCLCHQSCFIKTELLRQFPYDENYRIASDWKFLVRTLLLNNYTYKGYDGNVALYDNSGISSNKRSLKEERNAILKTMLSNRMFVGLNKHVIGESWEDEFFIRIKDSQIKRISYKFLWIIFKLLSCFKRERMWITQYPFRGGSK